MGEGGQVRPRAVPDEGSSPSGDPSRARQALDRTPVVAVGASAGGLEAPKSSSSRCPGTRTSVVVVQHLSRAREPAHARAPAARRSGSSRFRTGCSSRRAGSTSSRPTRRSSSGGRLRLHRRDEARGVRRCRSTPMRSLAPERGGAIGVVLSGTGTDGTQGLGAISAAGGRTYAQEPSTRSTTGCPGARSRRTS